MNSTNNYLKYRKQLFDKKNVTEDNTFHVKTFKYNTIHII